ncbi:response regulator transcription factor [Kitasatospora griseola]|uniref:response regulator transcription factor n=1 Tax=Kitasatospora griseola TaxID=2064 RepID=UPI00380B4EAC
MSPTAIRPSASGEMRAALDWAAEFFKSAFGAATKCPLLEPYLLQTLQLAARGLDNAEIAAELHVAVDTVKTRMRRIYTALGAKDRTLAVLTGLARGVIKPGDVLPDGPPATPRLLSPAGAAALTLVTCGLTRQEAAERLGISRDTLSSHLRTVMQRLGTNNRAHTAAVAAVLGVIDVQGVPGLPDPRALQCTTADPVGVA